MTPASIGVFDSGLGGLSVLQELRSVLPGADFIYVGDAGHCPYGGKTASAIIERAELITDFLLDQGVRLVVVACNTATIAAIETLRARYAVSFVGMEPAIKPAAALTRSGVVGVLATGAALAGEKLQRLIERHAAGVRVLTQPCPGLVEQVESGALDTPRTTALVQRYTGPLMQQGADVLVLGCTHYPFLRAAIQQQVGESVVLLDTGAAVARQTAALWSFEQDAGVGSGGNLKMFTTGESDTVAAVASRLWGSTLTVQRLP